MNGKQIFLMAMIPAAMAIVAGCQQSRDASMATALDEYHAAHYDAARGQATDVMLAGQGDDQDEAAYLAGLSAYRLGELDDAERHLLQAAGSSRAETSGQAKAMLGLIRVKQGRPSEAASYFTSASSQLTGEDARKAAHQAALAYEQAGNESASAMWAAKAGGRSTAAQASKSSMTSIAPSGKGFSLQVGAYQERARAQRAAQDVEPLARQHGLGSARVVPTVDQRGRTLYVVQFGWFDSRTAAAAARQRLGKLEYIVAHAAS